MPHTNKASAPVGVDIPEFEGRYVDLDGYTVGFETYKADVDPAGFFRGLPDDRCQCPHWGVVLTGSISFRFAGHTETYAAGDAYYAPAGHTPVMTAGTEVVEFSPTEALNATMTVVGANLAAASRRIVMTATTLTQHEARAHALAEKLIEFLETDEVPDGLFAADMFCDFTMPTWRLQASRCRGQHRAAAGRPPRAGDGAAVAVRSDADRVRPRSRGGLGLREASTGPVANCSAPTSATRASPSSRSTAPVTGMRRGGPSTPPR